MSTKSTTHVHDGDMDAPILTSIYKHIDGQPHAYGAKLAKFIATADCNGIDCLAAMIIAKFKRGKGDVYIHPPGTEGEHEYIYHVYSFEWGFRLRALASPGGPQLFDGSPEAFHEWAEAYAQQEAAQ